ncbi:hypothetical protein GGH92_010126 [Coemansia sp. RSA 2673]|nr:hypothetical protein GGH92_010126 [Coemansia sp. RSA 2673]
MHKSPASRLSPAGGLCRRCMQSSTMGILAQACTLHPCLPAGGTRGITGTTMQNTRQL